MSIVLVAWVGLSNLNSANVFQTNSMVLSSLGLMTLQGNRVIREMHAAVPNQH